MQLPYKRALAIIAGLALAGAGPALAQDTTEAGRAAMDTTSPAAGAIDTTSADTSAARDTSDTTGAADTSGTSGVQNPPGYRGMERDTTMFPPDEGPPAKAGQVEDRATGTYDDSTWNDTTGVEQNPAGYRGMERPVGGDSAAGHDTTSAGHDTTSAGHDTTSAGRDTTSVGDTQPRQDEEATRRLEPSESAGDTAAQAVDSAQ